MLLLLLCRFVLFLWILLKLGCSFRKNQPQEMEWLYPNTGECWAQLLPLPGKRVYPHFGKALSQGYIASASLVGCELDSMNRCGFISSLAGVSVLSICAVDKFLMFLHHGHMIRCRLNPFMLVVTLSETYLCPRKYWLHLPQVSAGDCSELLMVFTFKSNKVKEKK